MSDPSETRSQLSPDALEPDTALTPDAATWKYEVAVKEIEATIARIESGDLELAEVFDQFTVAVTDLRRCETFLAERQQQMDLLIETLNDEVEF